MAKKTDHSQDYNTRAYQLAYDLLTSRGDDERLIEAMKKGTQGLPYEGHAEVLARVISIELTLIHDLFTASNTFDAMQSFLDRLEDMTVLSKFDV